MNKKKQSGNSDGVVNIRGDHKCVLYRGGGWDGMELMGHHCCADQSIDISNQEAARLWNTVGWK